MPEQNFTEDQKAIERRRKIADMLMSQSQAPLESMGTAGGAPIPISWTQGLEKLMKAYMGSKGAERADIESKTLEDNRRKALVEAIQQAPGTIQTQQRMIGSPSDIDIGTITQKALQPQQSGLLGMGEMIEKNIQPPVTTRRPDDLASQMAWIQNIGDINPPSVPIAQALLAREDAQKAAAINAEQNRIAKQENAQAQRDFLTNIAGLKIGSAEKIAADKNLSSEDIAKIKADVATTKDAPLDVEEVDMGLPKPASTEWGGITDRKTRATTQAKVVLNATKSLKEDEDKVSGLKDSAAKAREFMELNKRVSTGSALDKTGVGQWAGSFGADNARMQSITSEIAPHMRPEGSGASSDFDAKQFVKATQSVDKPKATNDMIGNATIARAEREAEYLDYRQQYNTQNRTLQDSARHWKEYVNANPIFNPNPTVKGAIELNPNRKDWKEWFSEKNKSENQPAGTQSPVNSPTVLPSGFKPL